MQALASYLQDPDRSHGMGFRDLVAGMVMLGTLTVSDQAFAAIKWAGALGHHRLGLSGQCVQRSTKEEPMLLTMLSRLPAEVAPRFVPPDWRVGLRFIQQAFREAQPLLGGCYDRHGG